MPRALEALSHHPGGLPIGTLAAQLGVPAAGLREELLSFFAADAVGGAGQLQRDVSLEFTTAEGDDDIDPADADVVRLLTSRPLDELGLAWVPAAEVGRLLTVALALAATEPDDTALAGAIDRLAEVALLGAEHAPPSGGGPAALLRTAVQEQRRVRLVYARSWLPGVVERVVEPYRVVSTARGFEWIRSRRDDGSIRTYLVSGIASCELLEERFERPDDLADVLARTRCPRGCTSCSRTTRRGWPRRSPSARWPSWPATATTSSSRSTCCLPCASVWASSSCSPAPTPSSSSRPSSPTRSGHRRRVAGPPRARRRGSRTRTRRRHAMTARPLAELVHPEWARALAPVEAQVAAMGEFLRAEVAAGRGYLPPGPRVLRAFERPLSAVRVLVVGQDPYPTPGHAVGLSFSVAPDTRPLPRSLQNIFRELVTDLGAPAPTAETSRPGPTTGSCCSTVCSPWRRGRPAPTAARAGSR